MRFWGMVRAFIRFSMTVTLGRPELACCRTRTILGRRLGRDLFTFWWLPVRLNVIIRRFRGRFYLGRLALNWSARPLFACLFLFVLVGDDVYVELRHDGYFVRVAAVAFRDYDGLIARLRSWVGAEGVSIASFPLQAFIYRLRQREGFFAVIVGVWDRGEIFADYHLM